MALLVVRLLGWALHLETGRDESEDAELEAEDEPTVTAGQLVDADDTDTGLGFAPPGVEPVVWE